MLSTTNIFIRLFLYNHDFHCFTIQILLFCNEHQTLEPWSSQLGSKPRVCSHDMWKKGSPWTTLERRTFHCSLSLGWGVRPPLRPLWALARHSLGWVRGRADRQSAEIGVPLVWEGKSTAGHWESGACSRGQTLRDGFPVCTEHMQSTGAWGCLFLS